MENLEQPLNSQKNLYDTFCVELLYTYTDEELEFIKQKIISIWEEEDTIHSLTDLLEIERELTIRELQQ